MKNKLGLVNPIHLLFGLATLTLTLISAMFMVAIKLLIGYGHHPEMLITGFWWTFGVSVLLFLTTLCLLFLADRKNDHQKNDAELKPICNYIGDKEEDDEQIHVHLLH